MSLISSLLSPILSLLLTPLLTAGVCLLSIYAYFFPSSQYQNDGSVSESKRALYKEIGTFYDKCTGMWEEIWGDHLHHGYYDVAGKSQAASNRQASTPAAFRPGTYLKHQASEHYSAQIRMMEELLLRSNGFVRRNGDTGELEVVKQPARILDVGCGIGGSSFWLHTLFPQAKIDAISLSPVQIAKANSRKQQEGIDNVTFTVMNAMETQFDKHEFDLIWSLESAEHMPDKAVFLKEMNRVLKPGGQLLIATWVIREHRAQPLSTFETTLLSLLCKHFALPKWVDLGVFVNAGQELGLTGISTDNWSDHIHPFWPAIVRSSLSLSSIRALLLSGLVAVRAFIMSFAMIAGLRSGLIQFGVMTATKPKA